MTTPAGRAVAWGRSLGGRLTLLTALAVALAVAGASVASYALTAGTLRRQIDESLLVADVSVPPGAGDAVPGSGEVRALRDPETLCRVLESPPQVQPTMGWLQVLRADGSTCTAPGAVTVDPTAEERALAVDAQGPTILRDGTSTDGRHVRVLTSAVSDGFAIQIVRDLSDLDATLRRLALLLSVLTGLGIVIAALAGHVVARSGLRPVDRLTDAVETVGRTGDLTHPIPVHGHDEVARLATAFNRTTEALHTSRERQRLLVADAGHELRTPLTSLRTNVELLSRSERSGRALPEDDREALLSGLVVQARELSVLVDELVELAAGDGDDPAGTHEPVDLMDVVDRAVTRVRPRGPHRLHVTTSSRLVEGDAEALERAVVNILDNAMKFSPPDSTIDVEVTKGVLTVADRGVGVAAPDTGRVFDRFWRAATARALPGSGLGLAIVKDVVDRHGGTVSLAPRPGGGTVVTVTLPPAGHGRQLTADGGSDGRAPGG